ncbi:amidase [Mycolicibacterium frederiksbergense]|uniref:amidase n=1 Tax=Mycolicibacterium frederiksbergense TaxID=117567 RepID=UPI002475947B|nr:amidase [Mycolicibacterium frederiksbergense]
MSPSELLERYLDRIERFNPTINAFTTVAADSARADAARAESELRDGCLRGRLQGIPIAVKDNIDTKGIRTTIGSSFFQHDVPARDARVVEMLRAAGAVIVGKTATHEFACGVTTNNPHYGPTCNPVDPARISGGSSGGSAAAVAAGLAAASIGTDTAGSIRIPAALCGCVGFKPTYGSVSTAGVFPLSPSLDHVGPLTVDVADAAIMLDAIGGTGDNGPSTVVSDLRGPLPRIRIGIAPHLFTTGSDPDVKRSFDMAVATAANIGFDIVELPLSQDLLQRAFTAVFDTLLGDAQHIHRHRLEHERHRFGADVLQFLERPAPDADRISHARRNIRAVSTELRTALTDVNVLLTPTTPIPAPKINENRVQLDGMTVATSTALVLCTAIFNAGGLPALSLPGHPTPDGLPTGIQIIGAPNADRLVLKIGHHLERALRPTVDEP